MHMFPGPGFTDVLGDSTDEEEDFEDEIIANLPYLIDGADEV